MRILGISGHYHDAAAALIEDGVPVALAEEERFTRIKHDSSFPRNAINFVLERSGSKDLDYVVFYEKPFLKFERFALSSLSFFPQSRKVFVEGMLSYIKEKMWVKSLIKDALDIDGDRILFVPHHLSHSAGSFFCSPFEESAILSVDGVGEWTTTAIGTGEENRINLFKEMRFPHSLGLLYSAFTGYLGFKVNEGEYKLMGMSPYGAPIYEDKVRKLIDIKDDGSYRLDLDYLAFHTPTDRPYNDKFVALFGDPRDPKMEHKFEQRHADIAASIQKVTEDVLIKLANSAYEASGSKNLCITGGVALNSVANFKILNGTKFENIFIQPAAGDAGGALGAALFVYYSVLGNKRNYTMEHSYYGSDYDRSYIREFLENSGISYEEYGNGEIPQLIAEEIDGGKVVGLFHGRSEWGPRALGNRSILADARSKDMLRNVNLKIKFRESFRPFAPSVMYEDAETLFEIPRDDYPSRFMLYVCPVRQDVRDKGMLPAITHVDGSARPQVVIPDLSPRYHETLERFKELTGVGCFLNTSFNLSGEPIVNTPQNAYGSFSKSMMDTLVLENFVVSKSGRNS
ncbi:MAG TPA: carbamoyltransferase N-terminal domain-containing protein [Methanotrichaceae archaeon]|nr:carbamoyltransferase N-terminal domain-containing protein [Methanotrichaceae archaeon]